MDQLMLTPQERRLLDLTAAPLADDRREQLAEFLRAEIQEQPRRSRRRLFGFLAAIVAALTVSSGVAYALLSRTEAPSDPYTAYCYPEADSLDRGDGWEGNTLFAVGRPDGSGRSSIDAVSVCAEMWDLGVVHDPSVTPTRDTGNPVPVLTACVDDTGATVVLPADAGVCDRLGIASLL